MGTSFRLSAIIPLIYKKINIKKSLYIKGFLDTYYSGLVSLKPGGFLTSTVLLAETVLSSLSVQVMVKVVVLRKVIFTLPTVGICPMPLSTSQDFAPDTLQETVTVSPGFRGAVILKESIRSDPTPPPLPPPLESKICICLVAGAEETESLPDLSLRLQTKVYTSFPVFGVTVSDPEVCFSPLQSPWAEQESAYSEVQESLTGVPALNTTFPSFPSALISTRGTGKEGVYSL